MSRFCQSCSLEVKANKFSGHLRSETHKANVCEPWEVEGVQLLCQAFTNRAATYRIKANGVDIREYMESIKHVVFHLIESALAKHSNIKLNLELYGLYMLQTKGVTSIKSFNSKNKVVTTLSNFEDVYQDFKEEIHTKASEFEEAESGWALISLLYSEVNINKYER